MRVSVRRMGAQLERGLLTIDDSMTRNGSFPHCPSHLLEVQGRVGRAAAGPVGSEWSWVSERLTAPHPHP